MIANALRAETERYARRAKAHNPLFTRARDGSLTPAVVARYMKNLHHLLACSVSNLTFARDRARALGRMALAEHFEHKIEEEAGHEVWASNDLRTLDPRKDACVVPSMVALVDFVVATIDQDPERYLAYMLFAEYVTVLVGPEWLALLEERCGIPQPAMSAVGKHAELDRDHVEEALDCIDELVGDPARLPAMRDTLLDTARHFDRFCAEVTSRGEHVSAA